MSILTDPGKMLRPLIFLPMLLLLAQPLLAESAHFDLAVYEYGTVHTSTPADVRVSVAAKPEFYKADFQDAWGDPDNDGWFPYVPPVYWHIDTFNSPQGGYAMWCGRDSIPVPVRMSRRDTATIGTRSCAGRSALPTPWPLRT